MEDFGLISGMAEILSNFPLLDSRSADLILWWMDGENVVGVLEMKDGEKEFFDVAHFVAKMHYCIISMSISSKQARFHVYI